MGRIQTTVFARSLSNFTCKLWMMRGGTLLILGHRVKGQGQLRHSVYKTLWAGYRLHFFLDHFQTSHVSCGWWEEEPYLFWVKGSKVKVNFAPPPPCDGIPRFALSTISLELIFSVLLHNPYCCRCRLGMKTYIRDHLLFPIGGGGVI